MSFAWKHSGTRYLCVSYGKLKLGLNKVWSETKLSYCTNGYSAYFVGFDQIHTIRTGVQKHILSSRAQGDQRSMPLFCTSTHQFTQPSEYQTWAIWTIHALWVISNQSFLAELFWLWKAKVLIEHLFELGGFKMHSPHRRPSKATS